MPPRRHAAAAVAAGHWLAAILLLCVPAATAAAAAAAAPQGQEPWTLPLPDGSQPEGVAAGAEHDLWVACLSGAILHVDLHRNTTTVVHKEYGVHLSGVKFCKEQNALFVAGTLSGKGYVYHLAKQHAAPAPGGAGATGWRYSVASREVLDFGLPGQAYINDVTLTPERAYFTNSLKPLLYWVPRHHHQPASSSAGVAGVAAGGQPSTAAAAAKRPIGRVRTGQFFDTKVGQFRANGIATYASKPQKDVLLVANTHTGNLYRVVVSKDQAATATSKKAASATAAAHAAAAANAAAAKVSVAAMHAPAAAGAVAGQVAAVLKASRSAAEQQAGASTQAGAHASNATAADLIAMLRGKVLELSRNSTQPGSMPMTALLNDGTGAAAAAVGPSPNASSTGSGVVAVRMDGEPLPPQQPQKQQPEQQPEQLKPKQAKQGFVKQAQASVGKLMQAAKSLVPKAHVAAHQPGGSGAPATAAAAAAADAVPARPGTSNAQQLMQSLLKELRAQVATTPSGAPGTPTAAAAGPQAVPSWWSHLAAGVAAKLQSATKPAAGFTARVSQAALDDFGIQAAKRNGSSPINGRVLLGVNVLAANSRASAATKLNGASSSPWQWTSMLAEGVTAKLGGGGAHGGGVQDAEVAELFLPSIPGPISKRLLVDGLWVHRNATIFVADNYNSRIWGVDVRGGLEHTSVSCSWQGDALQVPTTLAMQDGRLWWVNAHLDSCFPFLPCPSHRFELRSVAPDSCRPWQPA